jgi:hypothetical protein
VKRPHLRKAADRIALALTSASLRKVADRIALALTSAAAGALGYSVLMFEDHQAVAANLVVGLLVAAVVVLILAHAGDEHRD